jgi:hypothetical protein
MWHNDEFLHPVPRLTICVAYTNHGDNNTTFYCCLFSAFRCSLSWLLWLMPNNAMVKNPFLRWCSCKANSVISSDIVTIRRGGIGRKCTTWGTLCTMVGGGGEPGDHIRKICLWSTRANWDWNQKPLSSQVQVSKMKHGSTWTHIQFNTSRTGIFSSIFIINH